MNLKNDLWYAVVLRYSTLVGWAIFLFSRRLLNKCIQIQFYFGAEISLKSGKGAGKSKTFYFTEVVPWLINKCLLECPRKYFLIFFQYVYLKYSHKKSICPKVRKNGFSLLSVFFYISSLLSTCILFHLICKRVDSINRL